MTSSRDKCVVCKQRITEAEWDPVCCEVCWDSMDAAERRMSDQWQREARLTDRPEGCRAHADRGGSP